MPRAPRFLLTAGIAATSFSLLATSTSAPHASADTADAPLGDGTALIIGPSFISTPSETYAQFADQLYLQPLGFTGDTQIVTTPEGLYPFTGPFTEGFDPSVAQGEKLVEQAIMAQIDTGTVSADNPVVVFGYSQSSVIASQLMPQLAADGVSPDDVHFVLVGNENAPNGGLLERFDLPAGTQPTIPSLGLTFSGAEANDLYPTDVYTNEYDGFADFPQYPINPLSDLNALLGIALNHTAYLGLSADQIQNAIELPTSSADTLTNYFMIPETTLPLLEPLQLIPFVGNPLADLLNPDLSVLVNLGYGNVADDYTGGFSQGFADVPTTLGFLPSASVLEQVPQALINGLQLGITDAIKDLSSPSNYDYTLPTWADELLTAAQIIPGSTFTGVVPTTFADLFDTFPPHTGLPLIDVATALLVTLPEIDYTEFTSELAAGNLMDAIGIPLAADIGIIPLALIGAIIPIPL
jgi:PE-PPE domain